MSNWSAAGEQWDDVTFHLVVAWSRNSLAIAENIVESATRKEVTYGAKIC